jgi:hypothetical protein
MAPKSAASLLTPTAISNLPKPEIPYDLTEPESRVWQAVVNALPADYFSSAQMDGLKSLCQCVVMKCEAKAELEAEKSKKRPRLTVLAQKKRDWVRLVELEHKLMRSMRLTHQAVYHHRTAATRHKDGKIEAMSGGELWGANEGVMG